jgi:hypothetical protein
MNENVLNYKKQTYHIMSASAQCHAVFELINLYELLEFIFIYPKFRKSLEYKALTWYMKEENNSSHYSGCNCWHLSSALILEWFRFYLNDVGFSPTNLTSVTCGTFQYPIRVCSIYVQNMVFHIVPPWPYNLSNRLRIFKTTWYVFSNAMESRSIVRVPFMEMKNLLRAHRC